MSNFKTLKMKRKITRAEKETDKRPEKGLGTWDSLLPAGDILHGCSIHWCKYNHTHRRWYLILNIWYLRIKTIFTDMDTCLMINQNNLATKWEDSCLDFFWAPILSDHLSLIVASSCRRAPRSRRARYKNQLMLQSRRHHHCQWQPWFPHPSRILQYFFQIVFKIACMLAIFS